MLEKAFHVCVSIHFCVDADAHVCVFIFVYECVPGTVTELNLTPELKVQKKALQKKPVPCLQERFVRF